MNIENVYQSLRVPNPPHTKLLLLVLDGVGDIATPGTNLLDSA